MKESFPGEEGGDFIPKLPDPPPLGQCPHWVSVHLQFRVCITASQLSLGRQVPCGSPRLVDPDRDGLTYQLAPHARGLHSQQQQRPQP